MESDPQLGLEELELRRTCNRFAAATPVRAGIVIRDPIHLATQRVATSTGTARDDDAGSVDELKTKHPAEETPGTIVHRQRGYISGCPRVAIRTMLTFSPKWIKPVLEGRKTVTFRKWPTARVTVGRSYTAATMGYPPKKFAMLEVTGLRRVKLGEIDEALAKKDGNSVEEVQAYWRKQGFDVDKELWLVEFRLKTD